MEWITIIGGIFNLLLAKCQQETSSEDPQQVLRDAYDSATGRMDPDLVRECMPAYRQASRKAFRQASREDRKTFKRLSTPEVYANVEQKLIEGMNASKSEVIEVFSRASEITGDDNS